VEKQPDDAFAYDGPGGVMAALVQQRGLLEQSGQEWHCPQQR
jgi:hypothetical protein